MLELKTKIPLKVSLDFAWEVISDTSSINKAIGLPAIDFSVSESVKTGKSKIWIFPAEWIEHPWQWSHRSYLKNRRSYSKGPLDWIESSFQLREQEKEVFVEIIFCAKPRYKVFVPILKLMFRVLKRNLERYFLSIENKNQFIHSISNPLPPNWQNRFAKLENENRNFLENFFQYAAPPDLQRIQPKRLALENKLDKDSLVLDFLKLSRQPVVRLQFDILCPHCRGPSQKLSNLGEVPKISHCESCDKDFDTSQDDTIEVLFRPHENFLETVDTVYCSAEPANRKHVLLAEQLVPDAECLLSIPQGIEIVELICKGQNSEKSLTFKVEEGNSTLRLSAPGTVITNQVRFVNDLTEIFEIETVYDIQSENALKVGELLSNETYKDFLGVQSLAPNVAVSLGEQTILFSDIVGSSEMYRTEGDTQAFDMVKEHFEKCYELVQKFKGTVVKTLGDSVMAAFPWNADALRCAVAMQDWFERPDSNLKIRISMNSGNCIAVSLHDGIDYFGNTVNLAAKLQSESKSGEIICAENMGELPFTEILEDYDVRIESRPVSGAWCKVSRKCLSIKALPKHQGS